MSLRFCFVTTFYPPFSFGGDAVAVQRLARALVSRGHHVTVVHDVDAYALMSGGHKPAAAKVDDGIERIALRSSTGWLAPLLAQQTGQPTVHRNTLKKIFRDGSFDVVNFHNVSLMGAPGVFSLAGKATRIYSAHEHWLVCPTHVLWRHKKEICPERQCIRCQLVYRRPPQLWRFSSWTLKQFGQIDEFIAMSEFSRKKHAEFGFPHEMTVLSPFATLETVSQSSSPNAKPYFFFAGRLEEIKGLQTVIPNLDAVPDAELLIAGTGSYQSELARLSSARVRFLGALDAQELARYYAHAIATIVPSITVETFGLSLIESFAAGTPVIARDVGPFPEIVNNSRGGILFSDDSSLRSAMQSLSGDAQLRGRLGQNGLRAFEKNWSEDVVVSKYLDIVGRAQMKRS